MNFNYFLHESVLLNFLISALHHNRTFFHDNNLVSQVKEVNCMGNEDSGPLSEHAFEHPMEDLLSHMRI